MSLAALKSSVAVGVIMMLNAVVFTAQAAMGVVMLKRVTFQLELFFWRGWVWGGGYSLSQWQTGVANICAQTQEMTSVQIMGEIPLKLCVCVCVISDSGRGSSLLDRAIADRRQMNAMTLPDFSDPDTGRRTHSMYDGRDPFTACQRRSFFCSSFVCPTMATVSRDIAHHL